MRIITAREQLELLSPWLIEASPARRSPPPNHDQLVQNVLDHWDSSTKEHRQQGSEWYPAAREWLKNLSDKTNGDYGRNAAIIAALSPMTTWDSNIANGAHFLMNYDPSTYKPQNVDPGWEMGGVTARENTDRARRIYHAAPGEYEQHLLSNGKKKKIHSFWRNFLGDDDAVTIDSHMAQAVLGEHGGVMDLKNAEKILGREGNYDALADAVRQAAKKRGVSPSAMQAAVWLKVNGADYNQKPWDLPSPTSGQLALDLKDPSRKPSKYETEYPVPEYTGRPINENRPEPGPYLESPGYHRPWARPEQPADPSLNLTPKKKLRRERDEALQSPQSEFGLVASLERSINASQMPQEWRSYSAASGLRRHAIPEHLDRKWKNDTMDAVLRSAPDNSGAHGLTMRDHPGDAPQHGYMVSIPGHEEHHPMADLSGATLGDYGDRKREVINRDPANYQGGWEQDRDWYNDVSRNHGDLWHADKDAFQGDQQALYDIDRNRAFDTDEAGWMTGAPWITGRREQ